MRAPTTTGRAVVLGAGLGGLVAATCLARAGWDVTVVESDADPGGRADSVDRDGSLVNLGAHALFLHGEGRRVLEGLGVDLPGSSPAAHRARLLVEGRLVGPWDPRLGGAGRVALALLRLARAARAGVPDDRSVAAWLDGVVGDGGARPVADALARTLLYGWTPERQAAEVLVTQLRAGARVRYLDGGWRHIVTQLTDLLHHAGGRLEHGAAAGRVSIAAGQVRGVTLRDGRDLPADAVVVAVGGPARAARVLATTPAAAALEAVDRAAVPVRVASLDVVLEPRPFPFTPIVVGVDEPVFLTTASDAADLGPDRRTVVHVTRYLAPDERSGAPHREGMELILDLAAPRWRDRVAHVRFHPSLTVTHDRVEAGRGLAGRAPVTAGGVAGLAFVGDWVGSRGFLSDAVLGSAVAAAEHVAASRVPAVV